MLQFRFGWVVVVWGAKLIISGVRESTDIGNLSTVNQKPVSFEIGIDIMPHERKIYHQLSLLLYRMDSTIIHSHAVLFP